MHCLPAGGRWANGGKCLGTRSEFNLDKGGAVELVCAAVRALSTPPWCPPPAVPPPGEAKAAKAVKAAKAAKAVVIGYLWWLLFVVCMWLCLM